MTQYWSSKIVGRINDQYVKVANLKGQLVWHAHGQEDALFQVLRSQLRIEFEGREEVVLHPGEFCVVPKGVRHNPVADEECWIVLIETMTTKHTGALQVPQTKSVEEQMIA